MRTFFLLAATGLLAACGGGGGSGSTVPGGSSAPTSATPTTTASATTTTSASTTTTNTSTTTTSALVSSMSGALTVINVASTSASNQTSVPITFGHVFAPGDVSSTEALTGKLADNSAIPFQVEAKASHADGSLRHAIISAIVPNLNAGQNVAIGLVKTARIANVAATPTALLNAGFTAGVNVTLGGQVYSASADDLLRNATYTNWLSGAIANEWLVSAPLKTSGGVDHPHLTARFAIRSYTGFNAARVDVTIENNWAYEAAPQNFTYDAAIMVGGSTVYSKTALTHFHHARWRKTFWWGTAPQVHIAHNTAYLIASKAVPNYDQTVAVSNTTLASMNAAWTGTKIEPMGNGQAAAYMPTTGGRPDIGLLPGWAAMYLLSMDQRAKDITLGTADLAGSWSSHYRNKITDRPVSLFDYPYMTILGHAPDTYNPATGLREAFPTCAVGASCTNTNIHDSSHQPGFAYLPYIVTGDFYYLEELQFWSMWNTFSDNPGYRENIKGLLKPDQVRGQAWSMRTLSEAAYITPDSDPLKTQFATLLSNNIDWYDTNYTNNIATNSLGILTHGYAIVYTSGTGMAPWMDDFFTSAIGHAVELGFSNAQPLLDWKAKFPISRMTGAGTCWIDGAIYSLKVRDSSASSIYSSIGQAYQASHTSTFNALTCASAEMASALGLQIGEMTGYSAVSTGFPSNMQPALAYSVDSGRSGGAAAWNVFTGRSVKPTYADGPQFAIVPR